MTTKELIAYLQEADPSGECRVRINGEMPLQPYKVEGYWDGPYVYINDEGEFVTSSKGFKVVLNTLEVYDYLERIIGNDLDAKWEDVKKHFVFDFSNYVYEKRNVTDQLSRYEREFDEYMKILREVLIAVKNPEWKDAEKK
jgi:hypothetical protein